METLCHPNDAPEANNSHPQFLSMYVWNLKNKLIYVCSVFSLNFADFKIYRRRKVGASTIVKRNIKRGTNKALRHGSI